MTNRERSQLQYLAKSSRPLWGGHLQRGERITDPDMERWLECGWIQVVGDKGYEITDLGRKALAVTNGTRGGVE